MGSLRINLASNHGPKHLACMTALRPCPTNGQDKAGPTSALCPEVCGGLQDPGLGPRVALAGPQGHYPSSWAAAGTCHTCPGGVSAGSEEWSVPAGLSAVTISSERKPPCVCSAAEGLSLHTGCAREVGSLLMLRVSNFHSVVFSHTWCSGTALEGERGRETDSVFNLDFMSFAYSCIHFLMSNRNTSSVWQNTNPWRTMMLWWEGHWAVSYDSTRSSSGPWFYISSLLLIIISFPIKCRYGKIITFKVSSSFGAQTCGGSPLWIALDEEMNVEFSESHPWPHQSLPLCGKASG